MTREGAISRHYILPLARSLYLLRQLGRLMRLFSDTLPRFLSARSGGLGIMLAFHGSPAVFPGGRDIFSGHRGVICGHRGIVCRRRGVAGFRATFSGCLATIWSRVATLYPGSHWTAAPARRSRGELRLRCRRLSRRILWRGGNDPRKSELGSVQDTEGLS